MHPWRRLKVRLSALQTYLFSHCCMSSVLSAIGSVSFRSRVQQPACITAWSAAYDRMHRAFWLLFDAGVLAVHVRYLLDERLHRAMLHGAHAMATSDTFPALQEQYLLHAGSCRPLLD
jgi:hypothetical protein